MLENYRSENNLDGEIRFLAANPNIKVKGIGTFLLNELERRKKEKKYFCLQMTNALINFTNIEDLIELEKKILNLT